MIDTQIQTHKKFYMQAIKWACTYHQDKVDSFFLNPL